MFSSVEQLVAYVAEGVRPPERLSIVEAAERHRRINNPAVWVGNSIVVGRVVRVKWLRDSVIEVQTNFARHSRISS